MSKIRIIAIWVIFLLSITGLSAQADDNHFGISGSIGVGTLAGNEPIYRVQPEYLKYYEVFFYSAGITYTSSPKILPFKLELGLDINYRDIYFLKSLHMGFPILGRGFFGKKKRVTLFGGFEPELLLGNNRTSTTNTSSSAIVLNRTLISGRLGFGYLFHSKILSSDYILELSYFRGLSQTLEIEQSGNFIANAYSRAILFSFKLIR